MLVHSQILCYYVPKMLPNVPSTVLLYFIAEGIRFKSKSRTLDRSRWHRQKSTLHHFYEPEEDETERWTVISCRVRLQQQYIICRTWFVYLDGCFPFKNNVKSVWALFCGVNNKPSLSLSLVPLSFTRAQVLLKFNITKVFFFFFIPASVLRWEADHLFLSSSYFFNKVNKCHCTIFDFPYKFHILKKLSWK